MAVGKYGKVVVIVFFKQKTAYEILTCDWSSDVCSSDLNINSDWSFIRKKNMETIREDSVLAVSNVSMYFIFMLYTYISQLVENRIASF